MIVHIERLQPVQELAYDFNSPACQLPKEFATLIGAAHLEACIRKLEEEVTLEARLIAEVEMSCSRCLKAHRQHVDECFKLIFLPEPQEQKAADELELRETDLYVEFYRDKIIDLEDIVREQLLLMLPFKPLCREECLGLCSSCGQDLNEGTCACPKDRIDPRFAVLKKLSGQKRTE
ncbi:hypothetical protein CSB45_10480 [candidate division KSB3 bacterium]|uniref:DUF177 domain-containing protein n=1 Tax=candidate division KSB3 bacterium TaxID=2044937 RepID=A0A2G6E3L8_9BACT|nr:MAG: hypothetical protein CSB45_10480 [candidate division KSB3 bacterium]PIE29161.1 MAG: hypothetical protein CSA57_10145 [candidate division KSB3 bacterium]